MTEIDSVLAGIQARADAASSAPWQMVDDGDGLHVACPDGRYLAEYVSAPDVRFIASARSDVPRLVAALRAVLDLHHLQVVVRDLTNQPVYGRCGCDGKWPCSTVSAIGAALEETLQPGLERGPVVPSKPATGLEETQ